MTEAEFRALAAQGYNRIPLVLATFADLDTPLSLYCKLARGRYTCLMESVVGGERFGRYSFIGLPAKVRNVLAQCVGLAAIVLPVLLAFDLWFGGWVNGC